jgi:uncharacterized lipoprotein YddW (UPF0748 family)
MRFLPRLPFLAALTFALGLGASAAPSAAQQPHRTAVWIRPPDNAQQLERTLVAARQAGFTEVLLEGFYHGRAIWKSEIAPMKLSYDALAVADAVARREGLGLNLWFEALYWRPAPSFGIPVTPLWKDGYATLTAAGKPSLDHGQLGFVDPADPEVGALLASLSAELGRLYPQVGLHLDYLRYPREATFGYHPAALAAFQAETNLNALAVNRHDDASNVAADWERWTQFRQRQVKALADRLIASYRGAGGQGLVSAAVFGGSDALQDWRSWSGLQVAMPMLYFPWTALYRVIPFQFAPGEDIWPGIKVRAGGVPLAEQLAFMHRLGYPNVAVFGWAPEAPGRQAP